MPSMDNPTFPGRELIAWIRGLLGRLENLLVAAWRRVRAVPRENWLTGLGLLGMLALVVITGTLVGFLLLSPLLWGAVFLAITTGWLVFSLFAANNLKLLLLHAKRADASVPHDK